MPETKTPHHHAALMAQYAADAAETDTPWERWQNKQAGEADWRDLTGSPVWSPVFEYRRKPATSAFPEPEDMAEHLRLLGYTVTKPLTFADVKPMTEAPPKGARYWVISAAEHDGVCSVPFANVAFDRLVIQRRTAYLDNEHALIAARHIFGLKGGEL